MSTWILLRGLTREAAHWGTFAQRFAQAIAPARLHLLDLPGNGRLHEMTSPTRVEGLLAACRNELHQQGLPPPYRLLALSLGGMVGVAWAQQASSEVAACVLVNTSLRSFSPLSQRLRPAVWPVLARLVLTRPDSLTVEQAILRLTSRRPFHHDQLPRAWAEIRQRHPVSISNLLRQLLAASRFQPSAQAPRAPLLLLASRQDALVHPACSESIAQRWGSALALHPRAGHDLPLDDPDWLIEQILAWPPALGGADVTLPATRDLPQHHSGACRPIIGTTPIATDF